MPLAKTRRKIAFLSTYPPRESEMASFTQDLVLALDHTGELETRVIAVNNSEKNRYDGKVIAEIDHTEKKDYLRIANKLNESDTDLLVIEHDFEIFGGKYGAYILDLIYNLKIPFAVTLHSLQSEPDPAHRNIIETLGQMSEKIITMANNTREMLQTSYGVDPDKIEVIHRGVSKKLFETRESLKKKYCYEDKQIISTFGPLEPERGIENGIKAVSEVAHSNPNILYLVSGQTLPAQTQECSAYRMELEELVEKLDLKDNVKFIGKNLTESERIQYLQMSDIYMTPYLAADRAVSGALACAVGYGSAIVSTPYLYAQEMLAEGRGSFAEFGSPNSLADCINDILGDPDKKARMEKDTIKIGRTMYWDKIARQYIDVFLKVIKCSSEM